MLMLGCGGPATFKEVQSQVLTPSCTFAACHTAAGAQGLVLDAPSYSRLVNVKATGPDGGQVLVVPGHPDQSYLYEKLTKMKPAAGVQMPNGGDPLPDAQLQLVHDWIAAGAMNN